jgi:hypothetical protein
MTANVAAPPPERLVRALESYIADEQHDTEACEALADEIADPVVRYLLLSIVADGRRHATLVRSMIDRLTWPTGAEHVCIPPLSEASEPLDAGAICPRVRAIIRDEHESARHVRHLARQDPGFYEGLYPLLLETLARDSEKHATILHFVLKRIEERAG